MLANPHEAQDVAQETMVRLWKANLMHLPAPQLTAWLYRTSTRLAVDVLRKTRHETGEAPPDVSSHERPDEQLDTRRYLAMLARRIPANELEVAVLHRVDGLTQEELAEVLDTTDRTVRRLLAKLDERLARIREETS
jgi:RNA polymerase sigma-70 factor (ECF subfamily)